MIAALLAGVCLIGIVGGVADWVSTASDRAYLARRGARNTARSVQSIGDYRR